MTVSPWPNRFSYLYAASPMSACPPSCVACAPSRATGSAGMPAHGRASRALPGCWEWPPTLPATDRLQRPSRSTQAPAQRPTIGMPSASFGGAPAREPSRATTAGRIAGNPMPQQTLRHQYVRETRQEDDARPSSLCSPRKRFDRNRGHLRCQASGDSRYVLPVARGCRSSCQIVVTADRPVASRMAAHRASAMGTTVIGTPAHFAVESSLLHRRPLRSTRTLTVRQYRRIVISHV